MVNASYRHGARNLCLFIIIYQFSLAFSSYINVYLQDNGFTATQIGVVNALGFVASFLCVFIAGLLSDRFQSIKKVLFPAFILSALSMALVPFIPVEIKGFSLIMTIYLSVSSGFRETAYALTDNIQVRGCAEHGYNFGLQRAGGSIAFAISGGLCALVVPKLGVSSTFWLFALTLIPAMWFLFRTEEPTYLKRSGSKFNLRPLKSNRPYWIFVVFMFAYYIACRPSSGMVTVYMQELNMDTDLYGLVVALRALLEIPSLIFMVRLRRKLPLPVLMILCALLNAVACLSMLGLVKSFAALVAVQCLAGIGNGLQIGAATNYINAIAPDELKATAASIMTMASSLAGLIGNLFGGGLMELLGGEMFYGLLGVWFILSAAAYCLMAKLFYVKFEINT
ncbi:MAG: MFS transporter [Oscillospiraceae bacterium]